MLLCVRATGQTWTRPPERRRPKDEIYLSDIKSVIATATLTKTNLYNGDGPLSLFDTPSSPSPLLTRTTSAL